MNNRPDRSSLLDAVRTIAVPDASPIEDQAQARAALRQWRNSLGLQPADVKTAANCNLDSATMDLQAK